MDLALLIDRYLPGAAYTGTLGDNTEQQLQDLIWTDERKPHPQLDDLTALLPELEAAEETAKINAMWKACEFYINNQFGNAELIKIAIWSERGVAQASTTEHWVQSVWNEYHRRKEAKEFNNDFSDMGTRPHTWFELVEGANQNA